MTTSNIDITFVGSLLAEVFGVNTPVFMPNWYLNADYPATPFPDVQVQEQLEEEDAPVRYGQKTFGSFWLKSGTYLRYNSTGELKEYSYDDLLMPLATLVDFDRPKVVTKSPTVGGSGTVKEIYGLEDWNISIRGIILPDEFNPSGQQSVQEQMDKIQSFHEVAGSVEVFGQVFAQRKIYRLVTESLEFKPVQGKPDMMQYAIQAVSDEDLLLTDIL